MEEVREGWMEPKKGEGGGGRRKIKEYSKAVLGLLLMVTR